MAFTGVRHTCEFQTSVPHSLTTDVCCFRKIPLNLYLSLSYDMVTWGLLHATGEERKGDHKSYPSVSLMSYNNDLSNKVHQFMQPWRECHGSNHTLSFFYLGPAPQVTLTPRTLYQAKNL